jgi:hypothetical protein
MTQETAKAGNAAYQRLARLVSQEPTNRLLADPFVEETNALAKFERCWCIEREPEGKL